MPNGDEYEIRKYNCPYCVREQDVEFHHSTYDEQTKRQLEYWKCLKCGDLNILESYKNFTKALSSHVKLLGKDLEQLIKKEGN